MADEEEFAPTQNYESGSDPDRSTVNEVSRTRPEGAMALPTQISRYRIERLLGEGGFGQVYLAYDEQLNRRVAVKVPHPRKIKGPGDAAAYMTEAQTVAGLDHASIVPVYDVGHTSDCPCFIVSKYIEGSDLSARIKTQRLDFRESAALIASVADALHYAHKQGLVHRDIKPGNILIGVDGKPWIVDFGLALREDNLDRATRYAGTTEYMSPEQARGEGHRVDGRSDIFSLGVVLYKLLSGRLPFRTGDLLSQTSGFDPKPLRQYDERLPAELERICFRALARRASERYSSAFEFAEDLRAFLATQNSVAEPSPGGGSVEGTSPPGSVTGSRSPLPISGSPAPATTSALSPSDIPVSDRQAPRIVPRGLRSYTSHDADFFLELLPGPRDRDGLPDCVRFWKTRIEETDADETFPVGLIYGPSGCGKSSLVKAGLLPRLSADVIAVYFEATPEDTESRLLQRLRKRCPGLNDTLNLKDSIAAIRRGDGIPADRKLLIVIDQFEQWLHTHPEDSDTELVQALRQCDGGRVQALVMVRDDFWMAASRFMRDLEVRLSEGHNSAAVELFPIAHARRVLAAFGRAFGILPAASDGVSGDGQRIPEQTAFLDQAVAGLAQDGKVTCVRLALFAEMMKGKTWTPATLTAMGGAEGVGVAFLEETFCATTAPPQHRYLQNPARAVLKALLPLSGSDIKGQMQSTAELQAAVAGSVRPNDFTALLQLLDSELRLITPTDPGGVISETGTIPDTQEGQKYYQLTHDYLVPSLRKWLTRKQKETRQGRSELKLAECSALWTSSPENRFLPSLPEAIGICLFTRTGQWTPPQRWMMKKAAAVYGRHSAFFFLTAGVLIWTAYRINYEFSRQKQELIARQQDETNKAEAGRMVGGLLQADIARVAESLDELNSYRKWADPELSDVFRDPAADPDHKLRAGLALVSGPSADSNSADPAVVDYLGRQLLVLPPGQFEHVRILLAPQRAALISQYWNVAQDAPDTAGHRFHAAAALASYDSKSPHWMNAELCDFIVERLVSVNPAYFGTYQSAFRPIADRLIGPLARIHARSKPEELSASLCTSLLADYAQDDPHTLSALITTADPRTFQTLFPVLQKHETQAATSMRAVLTSTPPFEWTDSPPDPQWQETSKDAKSAIESAHGLVTERFAFCIDLPWNRLPELTELLRVSGYRPVRVRPFLARNKSNSTVSEANPVAASNPVAESNPGNPAAALPEYADRSQDLRTSVVWVRDSRRWAMQVGVTRDQLPSSDVAARREQLLPEDIAWVPSTDPSEEPRFVALWADLDVSTERRHLLLGLTESELATTSAELNELGITTQTSISLRTGPTGQVVYDVIRSNTGAPAVMNSSQSGPGRNYPLLADLGLAVPAGLADPMEQFRRVLTDLDRLPRDAEPTREIRMSRAFANYRLGNAALALEDLNSLVETDSASVLIRQHRTLALAQMQNAEDARAELTEFTRLQTLESMRAFVRCQVSAWLGDDAQAFEQLRVAGEADGNEAADQYNLACAATLCSRIVRTRNPDLSRQFTDSAVTLLQSAVRNGFRDSKEIRSEPDFSALHSDPRFTALIGELEEPEYLIRLWKTELHREFRELSAATPQEFMRVCRPLIELGFRPQSLVAQNASLRHAVGSDLRIHSVWHRPLPSATEQKHLAGKQASAAIVLLRQGSREEILKMLRDAARPDVLSQFVHRCRDRDVKPEELLECVHLVETRRQTRTFAERDDDDRTLCALLLALGEFRFAELPNAERTSLVTQLLHWYQTDPRSAIHGASRWLLQRWDQHSALNEIDQQPVEYSPTREWFRTVIPLAEGNATEQNSAAFTFVVFPKSALVLGSPETEPFRKPTEVHHPVTITMPFAVLDREITLREFWQYQPAHVRSVSKPETPADHSAFEMTWPAAVGFCHWLTRRAGLPDADQSYTLRPEAGPAAGSPPDSENRDEAPPNWQLNLQRRGFRLPTEAEWETASRSGTLSAYSFGNDELLLPHYGWYEVNSNRWIHVPRSLRPGPRGLFDMHGNVFEWCHDWYAETITDSVDPVGAPSGFMRVTRGGSWGDPFGNLRCASRDAIHPMDRRENLGFRLAVTLPSEVQTSAESP